MRELALFAGAGGGILGGKILGWRTVCAVERDAHSAQVLAQQQNVKTLAPFPIWSEVSSFNGEEWRGLVDVVSGGFPCQDLSYAGRGAGLKGKRSGLWFEMVRIISEVRPRFVFVENVTSLTARGLGVVLGNLAEIGFRSEYGCLSAADVGADHKRERIWILGYSDNYGRTPAEVSGSAAQGSNKNQARQKQARKSEGSGQQHAPMANTNSEGLEGREISGSNGKDRKKSTYEQLARRDRAQRGYEWNQAEPGICRVSNGVAFRVDRLRAIGNGQVPLCAAVAWTQLLERINGR